MHRNANAIVDINIKMFISNLELFSFRNYTRETFCFDERLNILVGPNGSGKTNILEAIYFLRSKKSFRFSDNLALIKKESVQGENKSPTSMIRAVVFNSAIGRKHQLTAKIFPSKKEFLSESKTVQNLKRITPPIILFSPESLNEVKQGQENRRNLIDDYLETLGLDSAVTEYSKVLKQRNALLKKLKNQEVKDPKDLAWLDSLTDLFLQKALILTKVRIKILKEMEPFLTESLKQLSMDRESVELEYQISKQQVLRLSDEEIAEILIKKKTDLEVAERSLGTSLWGPHRNEILFLVQDCDARVFCSQGQQRSLILALKIAQIRHYRATHSNFPILLLDDVLSELDEEKRKILIEFLSELETQVFLTTTDQKLIGSFSKSRPSLIEIKQGKITNRAEQFEGAEYDNADYSI